MFPIHAILHPTDLSNPSQDALKMACSLAQELGVQLFLIDLAEDMPAVNGEKGHAISVGSEIDDDTMQRLKDPVRKVQILRLVEAAEPADRILDVAGRVGANLIVLGMFPPSRRGLLACALGEQLFRNASCPLLVVKTPVADEPNRDGEVSNSGMQLPHASRPRNRELVEETV